MAATCGALGPVIQQTQEGRGPFPSGAPHSKVGITLSKSTRLYKVVKREEKVALEGFPEKRTFKYRPEGSKGGTRQRAGKHRVPKYKGPEEGAGMCLKKHREASVAEAE